MEVSYTILKQFRIKQTFDTKICVSYDSSSGREHDEVVFTGQPGSIRMSVFPSNTLNQAIAYFLLSKPGTDPKAQI